MHAGGGGGGGGGSDEAFYAGIWRFIGTKILDDCSSGLPNSSTVDITVNQNGNNIVAKSGNITLTGTTNNEDGFNVGYESVSSNGCPVATAYIFKNASDGNADVGLGIAAQCGSPNGGCPVGSGRTGASTPSSVK